MTCEDVVDREIVEKYLHDQLGEDARESFEQHYFECNRCFDLLRTYRAMREELERTRALAQVEAPRRSWVWQWAWVPAMAVVLIAAGVTLWQRPSAGRFPPQSTQDQPSSPAGPPIDSGASRPPAPPAMTLADLGRVEPPVYTAPRLRGGPDEATVKFQEAMAQYQRREYRAAATQLRTAAALDPEAPHILFFLGVSNLMMGQAEAAVDAFRKTIALGDSAYLEDAHFFLAKAHLQMGNSGQAVAELERTIRMRGEREAESRTLLTQVQVLANPAK